MTVGPDEKGLTMLVTLSTKLTVEQRDEFLALAHSLDTSPAGLLRNLIERFLETGSGVYQSPDERIIDTSEDVTRSLVLLRFIADHIDASEAQRLMDETDAFLNEEANIINPQASDPDTAIPPPSQTFLQGEEMHHG